MKSETTKLVIFDADGTLRRCTVPGQPCPNKDGEWELMPGVKERLANTAAARFAVVSNQGGVGLGHMAEDTAVRLLTEMCDAAFPRGKGKLVHLLWCPHAPKAGCRCRKPSPLLLYQAMIEADALPSETMYIGDMESDREAAQRAGVPFAWAWQFFGWERPEPTEREKEAYRCLMDGPQPGYGA